jgi:hypothetical protein
MAKMGDIKGKIAMGAPLPHAYAFIPLEEFFVIHSLPFLVAQINVGSLYLLFIFTVPFIWVLLLARASLLLILPAIWTYL